MKVWVIFLSFLVVSTAYCGQFLELAANTADSNPVLPTEVPKDAVSRHGSIYLNVSSIQKIYYNNKALTCEIWTGQSVFYVKISNEDSKAIFRSFLSGIEYRAGDGAKEAMKKVAARSGFVPVDYVFERSLDSGGSKK